MEEDHMLQEGVDMRRLQLRVLRVVTELGNFPFVEQRRFVSEPFVFAGHFVVCLVA